MNEGTYTERTFTVAEAEADLDYMIEVFEEVHPNLYFQISTEAFARLRSALAPQETLTIHQFYRIATELGAAFGDGHTSARLPIDSASWALVLSL